MALQSSSSPSTVFSWWNISKSDDESRARWRNMKRKQENPWLWTASSWPQPSHLALSYCTFISAGVINHPTETRRLSPGDWYYSHRGLSKPRRFHLLQKASRIFADHTEASVMRVCVLQWRRSLFISFSDGDTSSSSPKRTGWFLKKKIKKNK